MKPFTIFFHRINLQIIEAEYPHLFIKGNEKKKLTLYPNIILKCKDIGMEKKKNYF